VSHKTTSLSLSAGLIGPQGCGKRRRMSTVQLEGAMSMWREHKGQAVYCTTPDFCHLTFRCYCSCNFIEAGFASSMQVVDMRIHLADD